MRPVMPMLDPHYGWKFVDSEVLFGLSTFLFVALFYLPISYFNAGHPISISFLYHLAASMSRYLLSIGTHFVHEISVS